MITLYTPATGFPDLEAKIAYGLARIGIEAFGADSVSIHNDGGFYRVVIDAPENSFKKLNSTFQLLLRRLLSSSYIPLNTPGISGRSAKKITVAENEEFSLDIFKSLRMVMNNTSSENLCRHEGISISNIIGFTVSTSFHQSRDKVDIILQYKNPKDKDSPKLTRRPTDPKNICKICGLVAIIGTWFASFMFNIGVRNNTREVVVIPIPKEIIQGINLQEIFALQHTLRKKWFDEEIPQQVIPLILLSKIPTSADLLNKLNLFIAVLSRQQGYHVDGLCLISLENYLQFLQSTSYNVATVEFLIRKQAVSSLLELNNIIYNQDKTRITKFARIYATETSGKKFINLLYPETAKYLLREVAMIDPKIIENPAINSLSRTLRYFIRERKYEYADAIRNARKDSNDFERIIANMLREAELRRVQQEQKLKEGKKIENWIHLPTDEDIKEVFRLANEDFEATKLALVTLAFSFPSKAKPIEANQEVEDA